VLPVVHSLHDVNDQLSRGRPFFVDIARDGIVLYEEPGHPLAQPKALSEADKHEEAQRHFDQWIPLSKHSVSLAEASIENGVARDAAFNLHQAVERAYHGLLLTLTLYSPKSHRIKNLRSKAEDLDTRLVEAWPRDSRVARRHFELLSRAYVEARYSASYEITAEELNWLIQRVKVLQDLVEVICRERLGQKKHS
jgi:HEPN domain-containing protein